MNTHIYQCFNNITLLLRVTTGIPTLHQSLIVTNQMPACIKTSGNKIFMG